MKVYIIISKVHLKIKLTKRMKIQKLKTFLHIMNPYMRSVSPALAERESPDKRPQTAVEADRRGHAEDGYDPDG